MTRLVVVLMMLVLLLALVGGGHAADQSLGPLPSNMAGHEFAFVVGHHHSGTTLMDLLLCSHPLVSCILGWLVDHVCSCCCVAQGVVTVLVRLCTFLARAHLQLHFKKKSHAHPHPMHIFTHPPPRTRHARIRAPTRTRTLSTSLDLSLGLSRPLFFSTHPPRAHGQIRVCQKTKGSTCRACTQAHDRKAGCFGLGSTQSHT